MAANDALPAVLVVNDDGIEAPGIKALVAVLGSAGFCRVFVCAPDVYVALPLLRALSVHPFPPPEGPDGGLGGADEAHSDAKHSMLSRVFALLLSAPLEKSITIRKTLEANLVEDYEGHILNPTCVFTSITIRKTLEANLVEDYEGAAVAYSLTGTPADCASAGLSVNVISGINKGANTGRQVSSRMLAFESTQKGHNLEAPQKAAASTDAHFSPAAATCLPLIRCVLEAATSGQLSSSGGDPLLLNVNVPLDPVKSKGFKLAQQGQERVAFSWTHIAKKCTGVQLAGMSGALNLPLPLVPPSSILHSLNPQQGFKLAQQGQARVAFPWTHIAKKRTGVQLAGMGGAAAGGRGLPGMMGGRGLPGMMGGRGLPGMVGGRGLPGMTGPPAVSLAEIGSVASAAVGAHLFPSYEGAARSKTPGEESKEDGGDEPWQPLHKMHFRHEPSGWDVLDKDPAFDSAALALGYVTLTPLAITAAIDIHSRLKEDLAWLAPLLPHDA
ncbi:unnamed protein product [Closterium sp. Naga37s-1]|nr:unnamed protein product [Closterium sp. Naga37s-1]